MTTVLLDTEDIDEAEAALGAHYAKIRLSGVPPGVDFSARIEHTDVGAVGVQRLEYGHKFDFDTDPLDDLSICLVQSGHLVQQSPVTDTTDIGRAGDVVAVGIHQGIPFSGQVGAGRYSTLVLGRRWLDEAAAAASGDRSGAVQLIRAEPVSLEANKHLAGVLTYIRDRIARDPFVFENPLLTDALARFT